MPDRRPAAPWDRRPGRRAGVHGRRRRDDGSVLMLMPAAVLVIVVLGAFAVDATVAFLAEREVANLSAGLANDIAGAALDPDAFYGDGAVRLDPARAEQVRDLAVAAYVPQYLEDVGVEQLAVVGDQVTVTVSATAPYVFSSALPGAPDGVAVSATASATARQG